MSVPDPKRTSPSHFLSAGWNRYDALSLTLGKAMRRRDFIGLISGAAAWPFAVRAQQPDKVWRIGILGPSRDTRATAAQYQAFSAELKALGFNEGKNFTINYGSGRMVPKSHCRRW